MLVGQKIELRPWSPDDLPALQSLRNNIALQRQLMSHVRGSSLEQVRDWLSAKSESADGVFFVVADKSSGHAAGYIQVIRMDLLNGTGRLGICIAPESQGKGMGGEAITLLADYLRNLFQLRKLLLEVLADNTAAIMLYTKLGFCETVRLHAHSHTGAGYSDVLVMEKLL